jgi:hypothetical protein
MPARPTMLSDDRAIQVEPGIQGPGYRAGARRFRIERAVSYRVTTQDRPRTGTGRTVRMSSACVWIATQEPLEQGLEIEVSVSWPVLLNGICPLKLVIDGTVADTSTGVAAVGIRRYEFRTQGLLLTRESLSRP